MLKIKCFICKNELSQQGGLLFSPPDAYSHCKKRHICKPCYNKLSLLSRQLSGEEQEECYCAKDKTYKCHYCVAKEKHPAGKVVKNV